MKEKNFKIIIIIIVLLIILGGIFYWSKWREGKIYTNCYRYTIKEMIEDYIHTMNNEEYMRLYDRLDKNRDQTLLELNFKILDMIKGGEWLKNFDRMYDFCLKVNGLKKFIPSL